MLPKGKTDIQNKLSEAFLFRDRSFSDMEVVTIPVAHIICISCLVYWRTSLFYQNYLCRSSFQKGIRKDGHG